MPGDDLAGRAFDARSSVEPGSCSGRSNPPSLNHHSGRLTRSRGCVARSPVQTDTRLYNLTAAHAPDWWLRADSGSVFIAPIDSGPGATPPFPYNAHGGGVPVFDFTVPAVRSAWPWVEECHLFL